LRSRLLECCHQMVGIEHQFFILHRKVF
jgi:hypothetical protein